MAELVHLDGKLSKYTNVVKGWQNRYFVLNPQLGILEYHISQNEAFNSHSKPRGLLSLSGAVIAPSIDDEYTFSVNATNGEVYKLRTASTKERQKWISHLRAVAHHYTAQIAQEHPPLSNQRKVRSASFKAQISTNLNKFKDQTSSEALSRSVGHEVANYQIPVTLNQVQQFSASSNSINSNTKPTSSEITVVESISAPGDFQPYPGTLWKGSQSSLNKQGRSIDAGKSLPKSNLKELTNVREILVSADNYHAGLMNMLESLHNRVDVQVQEAGNAEPSVDSNTPSLALDRDILLIKATSTAMLQSLSNSYCLLQKYHQRTTSAIPKNAAVSWMEPRKTVTPAFSGENKSETVQVVAFEVPQLADPKDEVKDSSVETDEDLGPMDEHKNVIMHLLSQLKLGMDLTKVTLPTFILERRSLLEMFADFLGHTDLFFSIPDGSTPEERMCRVLKFYLSSFHCGRRSQTAKKPYNPIIGEVFQCSYYVPKNGSNPQSETEPPSSTSHHRVQYLAEQVSHHPPVSAFFVSCPDKQMQMNSQIWTKSRFMNMTVGVNNIGEGTLTLLGLNENYVMNYPSAYARSILTVPWSELGGRCTITCEETGLSASVTFHTKPTYGGQPHRVTAEAKSQSGFVFCKVDGKWNGDLELTYCKNAADDKQVESEHLNLSDLPLYPKYVAPLEKQSQIESRKLWYDVTESLRRDDIVSATRHKSALEDLQREVEKRRQEDKRPVQTTYFNKTKGKDSDIYIHNDKLTPSSVALS